MPVVVYYGRYSGSAVGSSSSKELLTAGGRGKMQRNKLLYICTHAPVGEMKRRHEAPSSVGDGEKRIGERRNGELRGGQGRSRDKLA